MPAEYLKLASDAKGLPTMPNRFGPCPFGMPLPNVWHTAQLLVVSFLPSATVSWASCAWLAPADSASTAASTIDTLRMRFMVSLLSEGRSGFGGRPVGCPIGEGDDRPERAAARPGGPRRRRCPTL